MSGARPFSHLSGEERLQKVIAGAGLMSRRAAEVLIAAGRVSIDGRVAVLGDRVVSSRHRVEIDGIPIPVAPAHVTYLLYKPVGVISTASDPGGRPTVIDLVPSEPRVVPVGRLDADSEGLLLLSNDGDLVQFVTHPRYGITKTYLAEVDGQPAPQVLRRLLQGVDLEDGPAQALKVHLQASHGDRSLVVVVLGEGRNREVRRMFEAVGHPVRRLVRTAIGQLTDRQLKAGEWRTLEPKEVADLYRQAHLPQS
ncbi:MAG TPA: pseudouridine synthase [Acidimicrobiia bacterium]|nr:pseudouridine synthase [Acidimicrobiia bacterium]